MRFFERGDMRVDADAGIDRKRADPVGLAAGSRRDEIGEAEIGAVIGFFGRLSKASPPTTPKCAPATPIAATPSR